MLNLKDRQVKIEALHNFFDAEFSQGWSDRFKPTPDRLALFDLILYHIKNRGDEHLRILELGIGPGYLAHHILANLPDVQYEGLDFAKPMLSIASNRLKEFNTRLTLTQADLTEHNWLDKISVKPDVIVSTWALHDLLSKQNIASVYMNAHKCLAKDGLFMNGDFIKPERSTFNYEAGRIHPSEHIDLLDKAQFVDIKCLKIFEENVEQPTTSNNYACFYAKKTKQN